MTSDKKRTGARYRTIRVTCHLSPATRLLIAGTILFIAVPTGRPQPNDVQHASDFTSVEYFEPPYQQQMKSRLSGAEAQPQAGGLLVIRQLKLETFNLDGKPEMIVNAPECVYDTFNRVASSPGHLKVADRRRKIPRRRRRFFVAAKRFLPHHLKQRAHGD